MTTSTDTRPLEEAVFRRIAEDRGLGARLRSLPRAPRFALMLALVAVEAALFYFFLRRADFADYPAVRMLAVAVGYGGVLLAAGWLALRPLYLPDRALVRRAVIALGLVLPLLFALLPEVDNGRPPGSVGQHARWALFCFLDGAAVAAAVIVLARLLDRGAGPGMLLAAIAAGVTGALLLHVHCPINFPVHLLAGHATVPAAAIAAGIWLDRRRP